MKSVRCVDHGIPKVPMETCCLTVISSCWTGLSRCFTYSHTMCAWQPEPQLQFQPEIPWGSGPKGFFFFYKFDFNRGWLPLQVNGRNLVEDIKIAVMGFCLLWPCDRAFSPLFRITPIEDIPPALGSVANPSDVENSLLPHLVRDRRRKTQEISQPLSQLTATCATFYLHFRD